MTYLRFIDVDRLLYSFRANHGLSTQGARACGGWEAPDFEFRTHSQGHFLSAWAGQLLAILNASTVAGAQVVHDPDNGSPDNRWRFVPNAARRIPEPR